jgi:hypothetical protein
MAVSGQEAVQIDDPELYGYFKPRVELNRYAVVFLLPLFVGVVL